MEVRCPQCGAQNRDDSLDFPLCHRCHEELVRCRQCRHFGRSAQGASTCEHPVIGPLQVTPEHVPNCGLFAARRHSLTGSHARAHIHRAVLALVAVVLGGMVLFAASAVVSELEVPHTVYLDLLAEGPGPVSVGTDFCVNCLVHNQSGDTSEPVVLLVPAELLRLCAVTAVAPEPVRSEYRGGDRYLYYPPLRPHQWLDVRLDLAALHPGEVAFRPRVFTTDGALKAQAHLGIEVAR